MAKTKTHFFEITKVDHKVSKICMFCLSYESFSILLKQTKSVNCDEIYLPNSPVPASKTLVPLRPFVALICTCCVSKLASSTVLGTKY